MRRFVSILLAVAMLGIVIPAAPAAAVIDPPTTYICGATHYLTVSTNLKRTSPVNQLTWKGTARVDYRLCITRNATTGAILAIEPKVVYKANSWGYTASGYTAPIWVTFDPVTTNPKYGWTSFTMTVSAQYNQTAFWFPGCSANSHQATWKATFSKTGARSNVSQRVSTLKSGCWMSATAAGYRFN